MVEIRSFALFGIAHRTGLSFCLSNHKLCKAVAARFFAFLVHSHSNRCSATAAQFRRGSGRSHATPCIAPPLPFFSRLSISTAEQLLAPPLLIFSVLSDSLHFRRPASPYSATAALPFIAVAWHLATRQNNSVAYYSSSQENLPFPLFRHWPMPENLP